MKTEDVLTPDAVEFLHLLAREFAGEREELLEARHARARALRDGELPDFLDSTADVRAGDWRVPPAPADLADRRVEITGPTDRKMVINALNSGARVFMADFEDSNSPTWANMVDGQRNLTDAIARTIALETAGEDLRAERHRRDAARSPARVAPDRAALHVDGEPIRASLFDFGLYLLRNHEALRERGRGPTSTCRSSSPISRRGCGTASSSARRTSSASRAARCARRC